MTKSNIPSILTLLLLIGFAIFAFYYKDKIFAFAQNVIRPKDTKPSENKSDVGKNIFDEESTQQKEQAAKEKLIADEQAQIDLIKRAAIGNQPEDAQAARAATRNAIKSALLQKKTSTQSIRRY